MPDILSRHRRRRVHRVVDRARAARARRPRARHRQLLLGQAREPGRHRPRTSSSSRATSATTAALDARARRRRGGVSRGGDPVGAAVDGRSDREPRRQRDRDAQACSHAAKTAGVRRVVYAASSSAYGDTPTLPKIETMRARAAVAVRASPSWRASTTARCSRGAYGLETVCLRYFNVFGPRQDPKSEYAAVIPRFVTAALAGQERHASSATARSRATSATSTTSSRRTWRPASADAGVSGRVFNVACGVATDSATTSCA